jgi:hypothetical protein
MSMPEGTGQTEPRNRCLLNAAAREKPCLEHGTSRSGVGSTVDPEIESSQPDGFNHQSQGGALALYRAGVIPKDGPHGDCVTKALEADSCPHGPCCAGALHVMRSGQPRVVPSPGRRRELTRRSGSWTNRSWSRPLLRATSAATDQVALEARSLLQPEGASEEASD